MRMNKVCAQQAVQLACADVRLMKPDRLSELYHGLGLIHTVLFPLAMLVIRLTTHSHEMASPLYAQFFDLTTPDSLPDAFLPSPHVHRACV